MLLTRYLVKCGEKIELLSFWFDWGKVWWNVPVLFCVRKCQWRDNMLRRWIDWSKKTVKKVLILWLGKVSDSKRRTPTVRPIIIISLTIRQKTIRYIITFCKILLVETFSLLFNSFVFILLWCTSLGYLNYSLDIKPLSLPGFEPTSFSDFVQFFVLSFLLGFCNSINCDNLKNESYCKIICYIFVLNFVV